MFGDVDHPLNPLATHDIYAKGNMENILKNIPINISRTHDVMEKFCIGVSCSPKEIHSHMTLFKEFHDMSAWSYEEMT